MTSFFRLWHFPSAFHISNPGDKELAEVKLSDDEARALEGLERALRVEEPRLHARLRDMRPGGLKAWQVVLGLRSAPHARASDRRSTRIGDGHIDRCSRHRSAPCCRSSRWPRTGADQRAPVPPATGRGRWYRVLAFPLEVDP